MMKNVSAILFLAVAIVAMPARAATPAVWSGELKYQIAPVVAEDVRLDVPEELPVKRGRFKLFKPETNGKVTFLLPAGDVIDVLPYLDGQYQVSGDEGTHELIVIAAKDSNVVVKRMRVVIGSGTPTPGPSPKPVDPPAPPKPVEPAVTDPLHKDLLALFAAETSPAKDKAVMLLSAVYGDQKTVADNAAQVLADLRVQSKKAGLGDADVLLIRTRIGVELKAALPTSATAKIDDEGKKKLLDLFARLSRILALLK